MSVAPCETCGQNFVEWSVPNEIFNLVRGTVGIGYLCVSCFDTLADARGVRGIGVQFIFRGRACAALMPDREVSRLLALVTAELALAMSETRRLTAQVEMLDRGT